MSDYLPVLRKINNELRGGSSVYDGYQRGCGLEFDELKTRVSEDLDYGFAAEIAKARSVLLLERMMNLFLLCKFFLPRLPFGHIVEYGSFRGGSAMFMAALAQRFLPGAFDGDPLTMQKQFYSENETRLKQNTQLRRSCRDTEQGAGTHLGGGHLVVA